MDLLGQNYPGSDNFNVAPTSNVWVIRQNSADESSAWETVNARWWLIPNWAKEISTKYSMFNARAENLEKSAGFKVPFRQKRCVVPISGYYEWLRIKETKRPYHVKSCTPDPLILAGLWDEWLNPEVDEVITSFTIVTSEATKPLKFLHHRQPVILGRSDLSTWLRPDTDVKTLHTLLEPQLPHTLEAVPVSNFVGSTKNNGPKCIEPVGSAVLIPST